MATTPMTNRPFGAANPRVSVIGQGTWYIDDGDRAAAVAAVSISA